MRLPMDVGVGLDVRLTGVPHFEMSLRGRPDITLRSQDNPVVRETALRLMSKI